MAPPDMPAALYVKAVDAYCTGEPFGAAAQSAGYARVLRMTRDEWPKYICCVLTVREELIAEKRPWFRTSSITCSARACGSTPKGKSQQGGRARGWPRLLQPGTQHPAFRHGKPD